MFIAKLKTESDISPTLRVLKALKLGAKDIEINREGEISDLQKQSLHREFGIMLLFFGGLCLYVTAMIVTAFQKNVPQHPFVVVFIVSAVTASGVYIVRRHHHNVSTGHADTFTGRVRKHSLSKEWLLFVIDYENRTERIYNVNSKLYHAMIDGETYTIYAPSYWLEKIIGAEHAPQRAYLPVIEVASNPEGVR